MANQRNNAPPPPTKIAPVPSCLSRIGLDTILSLLVFGTVFALNAYVCDDAFMIFRTVDNVVSGFGLTWNPGERVQVFTGPLYTALLTIAYFPASLVRSPYDPTAIYLTALAVGFLCSAAGVVWFTRHARNWPELACGLLLLFASQAYVPFTSSGLETPVTLALVMLFYRVWFHSDGSWSMRRSTWLFATSSLAALNRLDSVLLFIPALAYEGVLLWREAGIKALAILCFWTSTPLLAWFAFSLMYFGAPFPNSYYAKMGFGADAAVLWQMGWGYLQQSWMTDPVTLLTIASTGVVVMVTLLAKRAGSVQTGLAWLGALAGTLYITKIGGDFIGFRFLAGPFVICVMTLVASTRCWPQAWRKAAFCGVLGLGSLYLALWPSSPLRTPRDLPATFDIKYYYPASTPLYYRPGKRFPFAAFHSVLNAEQCAAIKLSTRTVLTMAGGLRGFCSGPLAYTIDPLSITDPLIARLPAPPNLGLHIPGHIVKPIPNGYWESAVSGENRITDPGLHAFYDDVRLVVSGPLFSKARLKALWRLNVSDGGRYRGTYEVSPVPMPRDDR